MTARSPMMETLLDTWFVECRWWNGGWTAKTVTMIPAPGLRASLGTDFTLCFYWLVD